MLSGDEVLTARQPEPNTNTVRNHVLECPVYRRAAATRKSSRSGNFVTKWSRSVQTSLDRVK